MTILSASSYCNFSLSEITGPGSVTTLVIVSVINAFSFFIFPMSNEYFDIILLENYKSDNKHLDKYLHSRNYNNLQTL